MSATSFMKVCIKMTMSVTFLKSCDFTVPGPRLVYIFSRYFNFWTGVILNTLYTDILISGLELY